LPTLGVALPAICLAENGHFLPQELRKLIIVFRCLRLLFCAVIPKDNGT